MKSGSVAILCGLLVAAALLGACGGQVPAPTVAPAQPEVQATEAPAPTAAEEAAPAESGSQEQASLRVWSHQDDSFNAALQGLIDGYTAVHPNVSITLEVFDYDLFIQTLQTALPAKTEADVIQMFGSWVCSYVEGGNLAEVPANVVTLADAQEMFFSAPLGGYVCDGKLYGIPQEFNIEYGAILVNTGLAEEAGITDITKGWENWDAFIADGKKLAVLQDGVMTRAGFHYTAMDAISAMFYSLIVQNGGQYLTEKGFSVNTPEGRKALELMKRMVDEGLVDPVLFTDTQNWVGDSFFEETSAMGLVGPWVIPDYQEDFADVVAVTKYVPLPHDSKDPVFVAASGWGLSVSANSPAQDVAWDFVKYGTMDRDAALAHNLTSGTLPALKAEATGEAAAKLVEQFPYFAPFLDLLPYAQPEGAFPDRDLVWYEITYPTILEFLQGNKSIDETLETIDRQVGESM